MQDQKLTTKIQITGGGRDIPFNDNNIFSLPLSQIDTFTWECNAVLGLMLIWLDALKPLIKQYASFIVIILASHIKHIL